MQRHFFFFVFLLISFAGISIAHTSDSSSTTNSKMVVGGYQKRDMDDNDVNAEVAKLAIVAFEDYQHKQFAGKSSTMSLS